MQVFIIEITIPVIIFTVVSESDTLLLHLPKKCGFFLITKQCFYSKQVVMSTLPIYMVGSKIKIVMKVQFWDISIEILAYVLTVHDDWVDLLKGQW